MSILVKSLTVVIRIETIEKKYPGGMDTFMEDLPINPFCRDLNLAGIMFNDHKDTTEFIEKLESAGFSSEVNDEYDEIAVVSYYHGLILPCAWLETDITPNSKEKVEEPTCWLKGSTDKEIGICLGWNGVPALRLADQKKTVPPGMVKCPVCGEYKGSCKDSELNHIFTISGDVRESSHSSDPDTVITATCICDGTLCRICKKNKVHLIGSNSYYPDGNHIEHWPGCLAMRPCKECWEKEQKKNKKVKKSRIAKKKESL